MTKTPSTPKTVAEQKLKAGEAAPQVTLLDGLDGAEQTKLNGMAAAAAAAAAAIAQADDGLCHAHRFQQGEYLSCTLELEHEGYHADGDRGWRGDRRDVGEQRALAVDEPGSEPTA